MGVRDILVTHGKKLAPAPFWPGAVMLRAAFSVGLLLACCGLGGCAPRAAPQLPATELSPPASAGFVSVTPDGSAPTATYDDVLVGGSTRRLDPGYVLVKADDPKDPVFPTALAILLKAQAGGLPIYTTIMASPNLRPRAVEQAAATGELTNFGKQPGSAFLGAIGEALIIQDLKQNGAGVPPSSTSVVPQPGATSLPQGLSGTFPDLMVTQHGQCLPKLRGLFTERHHVDWKDTIGPGTGGLVSTVYLGPNKVISFWEVTTSTRYQFIKERADKIAVWAKVLGGFSSPGLSCSTPTTIVNAAVLGIDRGAYFSLSPAERMTVVNTVTGAGGFIRLFRNLAGNSIQHAMTLALQLQPVSRP